MCGVDDVERAKTKSDNAEEQSEILIKTEKTKTEKTEKEHKNREFNSEIPVTF